MWLAEKLTHCPRFSFGGEDLGRGFRYFLVQLVWSIPALIMSGLLMIPTTALERSDGGSAIAWIFIVLFAGGLFIYALFMMLFSPIIMANFAVKNTFGGAGFEIGNFFRRLGNNFGAWLLVFAGMLIGGLNCSSRFDRHSRWRSAHNDLCPVDGRPSDRSGLRRFGSKTIVQF